MRILLVTTRYPWPPRRGDQVRAAQMAELLAPEHQVVLLTPAPAAGQPPPPAGLEVETYGPAAIAPDPGPAGTATRLGAGGALRAIAGAVRGRPLQTALFSSPDLGRRLRRLAPGAGLVVLQLARLAGHLGDAGATPVLVDLIDDLALNFSRRAAFDRPWLRPALALEARLLARTQRLLAERAAGLLLVCERDRRHLLQRLSPALATRVATVGLAVEAAGPRGDLPAGTASPAPPPRLAFTGNLGYFVNADAIVWWLREVWPALAARHPGVRLVVAGDRPAAAVRRAVARAAREPRPGTPAAGGAVELIAPAPDLRAVLAGATLALAPLRCGSGVPVKVLEAWSAGVPVVASPWAAAGTTGVAGEDFLLAESAAEWVAAVSRLLADPEERRRLAANGRRRLAADYSRERVRSALLAAVERAVKEKDPPARSDR